MADDSSIVLQAGAALDAGGREIVVPETRVIKLSTIEGYDSLTSDCAYLGLVYDEIPVDEVFPAMEQDQEEKRYNHTVEGYRLTLLDESEAQSIPSSLGEFVQEQVLYSDQEIRLVQYVPRFVVRDSGLQVQVTLTKTGQGLGEYSFRYTLKTPGFVGEHGESEFQIAASGLRLTHGDSETLTCNLTPEAHVWSGGEAVITASELLVQKNGESFPIQSAWPAALKPVNRDITDSYLEAWYEKAMDKLLEESFDNKLWIARIELIRQKNAAILSAVLPPPFRQYSYNPQQLMDMRFLERFYPPAGRAPGGQPSGEAGAPAPVRGQEAFDISRVAASGVFDLGLGFGYNTREVIFSEEIMHGLGGGPVYVEAGVEYITAGGEKGQEKSEIYLGDVSLFAQEENPDRSERVYKVSVGVKVLPDRGTFIVGVLPKETSNLISLRVRWFAMRVGEVERQIRTQHAERYIVITPDTIKVSPKGTAHLNPVFVGMQAEACRFTVVDEDGGDVDNNGVYTAPAKEGVYEIRVSAISDPSVYACAFAMVTQK
jgi:hypothetical protein